MHVGTSGGFTGDVGGAHLPGTEQHPPWLQERFFLEPTRFFFEFGLALGLLERSNTGDDLSKNLKS